MKHIFIYFDIYRPFGINSVSLFLIFNLVPTLNPYYSPLKIIKIILSSWVTSPVQQVPSTKNNLTNNWPKSWSMFGRPNPITSLFFPWNTKMPPNTSLKTLNNPWPYSLKSFSYAQSTISSKNSPFNSAMTNSSQILMFSLKDLISKYLNFSFTLFPWLTPMKIREKMMPNLNKNCPGQSESL